MTRVFVYPYKRGSKSARDLARALGAKRIRLERSRYRYREGDRIINWGSSSCPHTEGVINHPSCVRLASDKLSTLREFQRAGVNCPDFTTDIEKATRMALEGPVIARTLLRSSGGRGITFIPREGLIEPEIDGHPVRLWVRYIKKVKEFRVHVMGGRVIDVQEKRRRRGEGDINHRIRNHEGGWVFCREDIEPDPRRDELAIKACSALGLDFGAVDIVFNRHYDVYNALEVNTAPGLQGSTLETYKNALTEMYTL